ncbi:MAG: gamma-glutamyl-phosphate reductase, partial [Actinomycetota bacterium]|nr:gamma-glutamyl-phosphate reductase [Actinomycetota bacterium]
MPADVSDDKCATSSSLADLGRRSKDAARSLATATSGAKDQALHIAADLLVEKAGVLLEANALDVEHASAEGATEAQLDRLRLDAQRVESMARGLRDV